MATRVTPNSSPTDKRPIDGGDVAHETASSDEPSSAHVPFMRRRVLGPFSGAQVLANLLAIVVAAVVLIVATSPLAGGPPSSGLGAPGASFYLVGAQQPGLAIGQPAPEFMGTNNGQQVGLTDLGGKPIRLADYRGRPVWINFWATWCPPCQAETPILREVYNEYAGQGLALIAISVQETSVDDVGAYVQRYGLDYTVAFDSTSAIFHLYKAFGLPTQVFVDRDGIVRDVILGPVTRDSAEKEVKSLFGP